MLPYSNCFAYVPERRLPLETEKKSMLSNRKVKINHLVLKF